MNKILIAFIITSVSTQTDPSFPNPVRKGTTEVVFTYTTDPNTHDAICYDVSGTMTQLGVCNKNNLIVTCTTIPTTVPAEIALFSCVKTTPTTNTDLNLKLMFKDQNVSSVSPTWIKVSTDSSLALTMIFTVETDDEAKLSYQLGTATAVALKSCTKTAKVATCPVKIDDEGTYKILFNNLDSTKTLLVTGSYIGLSLALINLLFLF